MTTVSTGARPVPPAAGFAEGISVPALSRADEVLDGLASPEGREDPYPWYRELRELAPFCRSGWDGFLRGVGNLPLRVTLR